MSIKDIRRGLRFASRAIDNDRQYIITAIRIGAECKGDEELVQVLDIVSRVLGWLGRK
jgi:hypothetical protein